MDPNIQLVESETMGISENWPSEDAVGYLTTGIG